MSEPYIDQGIIPGIGFVSGAPSFVPEFIQSPPGGTATSNCLWVSVSGSDANSGTMNAPLATLQGGLTKRATLPSSQLITIYILPGSYSSLSALAVPDNTALVGIPAGSATQYLVFPGEPVYTGSPITFSGLITLGSQTVLNSTIFLSGLNIEGEVRIIHSYATVFFYCCNIDNRNSAVSLYSGTALTIGPNAYCYIDTCSINSSQFLYPVINSSGITLSITNSQIYAYYAGTSTQACAPVILTSSIGFSLTKSSVTSNYDSVNNTAPLIQTVYSSQGNIDAEILYTTLKYTSAAVDADSTNLKVCFYVSGGANVNLKIRNCALLQPGGNANVILSSASTLAVTSGGNFALSGKSSISANSNTALVNVA